MWCCIVCCWGALPAPAIKPAMSVILLKTCSRFCIDNALG
jgi:hypothetical protein